MTIRLSYKRNKKDTFNETPRILVALLQHTVSLALCPQ